MNTHNIIQDIIAAKELYVVTGQWAITARRQGLAGSYQYQVLEQKPAIPDNAVIVTGNQHTILIQSEDRDTVVPPTSVEGYVGIWTKGICHPVFVQTFTDYLSEITERRIPTGTTVFVLRPAVAIHLDSGPVLIRANRENKPMSITLTDLRIQKNDLTVASIDRSFVQMFPEWVIGRFGSYYVRTHVSGTPVVAVDIDGTLHAAAWVDWNRSVIRSIENNSAVSLPLPREWQLWLALIPIHKLR